MRGRAVVGLTAILLVLAVGGCGLVRIPTPAPTPDEAVAVIDHTGWLVGSDSSGPGPPPGADPMATQVFNPPAQPRTLVVAWTSGVCINGRSITLGTTDVGGLRVDLDRGTQLSESCPAMAETHAVGLRFDREVPAAEVELRIHGAP